MRSIEYLVQLFPDKTGAELIEIQKQEKSEDERAFQKANKEKLALIKDINENGGYYRGKFGMTQQFYYSFSNMRMEGNNIYCNVLQITCFFEANDKINIEVRESDYKQFEDYGVSIYEKVNKEDFDKVLDGDWQKVLEFIKSLNDRYEISDEHPMKVEEKIVNSLKRKGTI